MNYHIVTPFSRWQNFKLLAAMLQKEGVASWNLILGDNEQYDSDLVSTVTNKEWLKIHYRKAVPPQLNQGLHLVNEFMADYDFVDQDRYLFLPDDDWLEPGFFSKITDTESEVVVVSMKRGDVVPEGSRNPCWNLIAGRDALRYGLTGFEQGIFRGSVLNNIRRRGFNLGMLNEDHLFTACHEHTAAFFPEVFILFNYLEPGRWKDAPICQHS